jgi:hypothetical protein
VLSIVMLFISQTYPSQIEEVGNSMEDDMRALARRVFSRVVRPGSLATALRRVDHVFDTMPRRHPVSTDVVVTTRTRTQTRRPRLGPPRAPFFMDFTLTPRELHGRALEVVRDAYPAHVGFPDDIPHGVAFTVWGRSWVVQESSLGPDAGMGLFACDDIVVPDGCTPEDHPVLFPFHGPKYGDSAWRILSRQCPTFGRYALHIDLDPRWSFIDGYPPRTSNVAGYINSCRGRVRQGTLPNAEWVEYVDHTHPLIPAKYSHFVLTHAIRSIAAGDEILVDYDWRRA